MTNAERLAFIEANSYLYPTSIADLRWLIAEVRRLTADSDYCATHFAECSKGDSAYRAGKTLADNPHTEDRANSLFDEAWETGWKAAAYDGEYARGRAEERAAIVEWLYSETMKRGKLDTEQKRMTGVLVYHLMQQIERGEHVAEVKDAT